MIPLKQALMLLKNWAQNDFLANSEAKSERDGYLSYRAEWHAATWGVACAIIALVTGNIQSLSVGVGWLLTRGGDRKVPEIIPYPKQFMKESLYVIAHAAGTYVVGSLLLMLL